MSYLLLYLDLLEVPADSGLTASRQTAQFVGVTALRVQTGCRWGECIELVKVSLHREHVTTLCAHVITLIFQNL